MIATLWFFSSSPFSFFRYLLFQCRTLRDWRVSQCSLLANLSILLVDAIWWLMVTNSFCIPRERVSVAAWIPPIVRLANWTVSVGLLPAFSVCVPCSVFGDGVDLRGKSAAGIIIWYENYVVLLTRTSYKASNCRGAHVSSPVIIPVEWASNGVTLRRRRRRDRVPQAHRVPQV